jgi:acetyl-CoA carboxylase biotin carboxyl carrier protein
MIDFKFVEQLIEALDNSTLDSIEIERGGSRVRLAKTPTVIAAASGAVTSAPLAAAPGAPQGEAVAAADATTPAPSNLLEVTSPMVGTFYLSPAPDAPSYVHVGDRVSLGDTLCIIEAMKLMNELECEISGTVTEICVENAHPVEFGQVLFRVDPS